MTDKHVKQKIGDRSPSVTLGEKIRELRDRIGLNQQLFALDLGVSQATVSEWEKNQYLPSPMALLAIGRMDIHNSTWWYEQAGPKFAERLKRTHLPQIERLMKERDPRIEWIPLLQDTVAAGAPREIGERQVERDLPFAAELLPQSGNLRALRVAGDSMAPVVNDGYIVIVDLNQRDPKDLVGRMVAAREGEGVTIKWLRKDRDIYLLVPQHVSPRIPVRVMRAEEDWAIVGAILKWIGTPPSTKSDTNG